MKWLKQQASSIVELVGVALIVAGVALWSTAAALIVAGVGLVMLSAGYSSTGKADMTRKAER